LGHTMKANRSAGGFHAVVLTMPVTKRNCNPKVWESM
jgi:hypothetical protein